MSSFVEEMEEMIEIVSDWCVEVVEDVVEALTEGGRPFDTVSLSKEDKMEEYSAYRGNPQKWIDWITQRATTIIEKLSENGVDQPGIESVHPWDIAIKLALQYSIELESESLGQVNG